MSASIGSPSSSVQAYNIENMPAPVTRLPGERDQSFVNRVFTKMAKVKKESEDKVNALKASAAAHHAKGMEHVANAAKYTAEADMHAATKAAAAQRIEQRNVQIARAKQILQQRQAQAALAMPQPAAGSPLKA